LYFVFREELNNGKEVDLDRIMQSFGGADNSVAMISQDTSLVDALVFWKNGGNDNGDDIPKLVSLTE
jgi:hypothetical protein